MSVKRRGGAPRLGRDLSAGAHGFGCRVRRAAMARRPLSRLASTMLRSRKRGACARARSERPEQSLKLIQREVPQLAAGDDLRHPTSPVCREAPTIRAFSAVPGSHRRQGKACGRRPKWPKSGERGEKSIAGGVAPPDIESRLSGRRREPQARKRRPAGLPRQLSYLRRRQSAVSGHLRDLDRTGGSTPCEHSHWSCAPANPLDLGPEWPISHELQKPADGKDCFCPARMGLFRHFSFTPPQAALRRSDDFPRRRCGMGWRRSSGHWLSCYARPGQGTG